MKLNLGDRVKINDEGRRIYRCEGNEYNPLNFTGTVIQHQGHDQVRVAWDNGLHNSYSIETLTKIGG